MKNKICVVFTGGTIGSSKKDGKVSLSNSTGKLLLDKYFERYGRSVEFTILTPAEFLSENVQVDDLYKIVEFIKGIDYSSYDGIILTHGTDTLDFTASYLSHTLSIPIPVVLVSALYPLMDLRSRGVENFYLAVEFIKKSRKKGVYISYTNPRSTTAIYPATCITSAREMTGKIESVKGIVARKKGDDIAFNPRYEEEEVKKFDSHLLSDEVFTFRVSALQDLSRVSFSEKPKIVILSPYHSGTVCTVGKYDIKKFLQKMKDMGTKVVLCGVSRDQNVYESVDGLYDECKVLYDRTLTDSTVLAMLTLSNGEDIDSL